MKGEIWKEIPYTEGYYVVSNLGRVKALARRVYSDTAPNGRLIKEKILSQYVLIQKNKHIGDKVFELSVTYCFEHNIYRAMVRRLVYEAFIQPVTTEKMEGKLVYPLDGNGLNCRASNLGLATRGELRLMELKKKRYIPPFHILPREYYLKQAIKGGKVRRRKVNKYNPSGVLMATYSSLTQAARKNNTSVGNIGQCITGKLKTLKGSVYRYKEDGYKGELKDWKGYEKKVVQYRIDGKKIKEFRSISEAAKKLVIVPGSISRVAKLRSKHAGGFVWRYKGEPYNGEYKKVLEKRKFVQYSLSGEILQSYDSISLAAKNTNCPYEGIRLALNGKANTSGGYIWKWYNE